MDSSNHEHTASAARPPRASPLAEPKNGTPTAVKDTNIASTAVKRPLASATLSPCAHEAPAAQVAAADNQTRENTTNSKAIQNTKKKKPFQAQKQLPSKAKKTLKKTKKKKKFSSILSGMMKPKEKKAADLVKDREEALRKHLGGGAFAKVDKI